MGVNMFPQLNCLGGDPVCGGTIWIDDVSTDTTWNSSEFTQGGGGGPSIVMFISHAAALMANYWHVATLAVCAWRHRVLAMQYATGVYVAYAISRRSQGAFMTATQRGYYGVLTERQ